MNSENLIRIDEFCLHHSIEITFISALKEYGMIDVIVIDKNEYLSLEQLAIAEKIIRLHHDLQINLEGIDVIMNLLNQIDIYKSQLLIAQNKIDFFQN